MSSDAPDRVRDLFHKALEHAPTTRQDFLKTACGDNHSLYDEVWQLLNVYQDIETVERPASVDRLPGLRFGAYEIVRLIGAGGMGRVYLGRRADGAFSRDVAIKVIDAATHSEELVERFEQERRILASLRHPCIAQLFDAGRSESGHLYFVMEYIDGLPITQFCNRRALPLRERVAMFIRVCEAVVEAHRSLIIHRDLKPGNILVDSTGTPKLLDFGIAKPLARSGLDSAETMPMLRRATPAYASPEQLQGEAAHTGMDVFSLGVVLHELTTGRLPWPVNEDDRTGTGVGRFLAPSFGLAREITAPSNSSQTSGVTPPFGPQELEGDLDAIILKALQDDIHHRYASVDSLRTDLEAYLANLPVSARPISVRERAKKFVRRNPAMTALGATAALALVVATLGLARLWYVAARDRDVANEQIQNLKTLANSTFALDGSLADLPGATTIRRQLAEAINLYLSRVQVGQDRRLALEIAESYRQLGDVQGNPNTPNLGDEAAALRSYQAALALLEPLRSDGSADDDLTVALVKTHASIGDVLAAQRSFDSASTQYGTALTLANTLSDRPSNQPAHRVLVAGIHRPLGDVKRAQGDLQGAVAEFEKALAFDLANTRQFPEDPEHRRLLALSHFRIAGAHAAAGDTIEARNNYQRAAEILSELARQGHGGAGLRREVAFGRAHLGVLLEAEGNKEGLGEITRAADDLRSLVDADPADVRVRHDLMSTLVQLGDAARADQTEVAKKAYSEAKDIALTLAVGATPDSSARRELELIERRLADIAAGVKVTDVRLFKVLGDRRVLFQPGDPPPQVSTPIAVTPTVSPGWTTYLLVFGAEGPASLLEEADLKRSGWVVPAAGPPPSQTILLVSSARALSAQEKQSLLTDVNAIDGPRTVEWDSQILWTPTEETIESTATARGFETSPWVAAIRKRIAQLGRVAVTGRTFAIAPNH
jgi:non-specific serine/threonine protein kinase/serine/threonine-protein kinase